jgi:hypothetical protein
MKPEISKVLSPRNKHLLKFAGYSLNDDGSYTDAKGRRHIFDNSFCEQHRDTLEAKIPAAKKGRFEYEMPRSQSVHFNCQTGLFGTPLQD